MRNEPKPLDRNRAARAYALRDGLADLQAQGRPVRLDYFKRDGSKSSSEGDIQYFNGRDGMDTMSVTILDPEKGSRTINLDLVEYVRPI